jgi:hypothetical protein
MIDSTFDEMIHPDDLLEAVDIELAPEAFEGPLTCAECGSAMERVISTTTVYDRRITVEFEQYRCPQCGWERMSLEQARQLQAINHFFAHLLAEASSTREPSLARVRSLTASHFLVEMG